MLTGLESVQLWYSSGMNTRHRHWQCANSVTWLLSSSGGWPGRNITIWIECRIMDILHGIRIMAFQWWRTLTLTSYDTYISIIVPFKPHTPDSKLRWSIPPREYRLAHGDRETFRFTSLRAGVLLAKSLNLGRSVAAISSEKPIIVIALAPWSIETQGKSSQLVIFLQVRENQPDNRLGHMRTDFKDNFREQT